MDKGTLVVEAWVLSHWPEPPNDIHREMHGEELVWYIRPPGEYDTVMRVWITHHVMRFPELAKDRVRQANRWVPAIKAGEYQGVRLAKHGVHPLTSLSETA